MKTWIKWYTEILDDADVGSLSWAERGVFSAMCALAGKLDLRDDNDMETGELDTVERVAWHLRCTVAEIQPAIDAFVQRGFIDVQDGVLFVTHYPDRQAHSPSEDREAVAARVRRHRAQKHQACNEDVTPLHAEGNDGVTQLEKKRIEENREEEKRTEKTVAPKAAPVVVKPPKHVIDHETIPESELLREVMHAFQRGTAQSETDSVPYGKVRTDLRTLLDDKRAAADIEAYARYLKAGWWGDKSLSVGKVVEGIGQWIAQGRPAKSNGNAGGHSPGPLTTQLDQTLDYVNKRIAEERAKEAAGVTVGGNT